MKINRSTTELKKSAKLIPKASDLQIEKEEKGVRTEKGEKSEDEGEAGARDEGGAEGGVEDGGSGDGGGEQHLGCEDAVDLADEAPAELVLAAGEARVEGRAGLEVDTEAVDLIQPLEAEHLRLSRRTSALVFVWS